jgi:hypothetical protein
MTSKEQAALRRLAKKLSAMRATLSKDERVWLDRLILGEQEVAAHAMTAPQRVTRVTKATAAQVAAHAMTAPQRVTRVTKATAAQVAAHAMTAPQRVTRVTKATAAEVAAHTAAIPQKVTRVTRVQASQAAANSQALLEFDATTGGYRINENAAL